MTQAEIKQEMCEAIDNAKEYNFGMNDATLYAAKDAFFVKNNITDEVYKYNTYKEAAGKARMIVAFAKAM